MARERNANHLGPYGWRWQTFGGKLMLVTDGGGADVVLSTFTEKRASGLSTCGQGGRMEPLRPDHPLAILLASLPDIVAVALDIAASDDRPRYLPELRAALHRAGLLDSDGRALIEARKIASPA